MRSSIKYFILLYYFFVTTSTLPVKEKVKIKYPSAKYGSLKEKNLKDKKLIAAAIDRWKPEYGNVWELSGLHEGDIMLSENSLRNIMTNESKKWSDGIVPYLIEEDAFEEDEVKKIKSALDDFHRKTCIRFRPYKEGDAHFITVKSDDPGCWSYVGKHDEGQVVNLQPPNCLKHGTIIHELMHALGFYHQQSAADRDDWIDVVWKNIRADRQHNFNKYDKASVTDYGVAYDYESVMHYSATAFSKNGKKTIIPKVGNVTLGQREGFSAKDVKKINLMYKAQCENREKKRYRDVAVE
ncbi:zinc metalloproteinase nas-14 [Trichogramma pretiosum]|nr:zinc metalloproteinase nas-14 [Trichogramma pretiosum]